MADLSQAHILLTGATGFLGSEVFARLAKRGLTGRVWVLGRRKPDLETGLFAERMTEHAVGAEAVNAATFVTADFLDVDGFRAALAKLPDGPWVVVHLAALIHGDGAREVQDRVNVGVTQDLVDWLNKRGGHFVFTSSVVAFGGTWVPGIRSERDFANFPSESLVFDYYCTKRQAHLDVDTRAQVPVTFLCPGVVHGSLENYKESRGHLKKLREGRLNVAPPGGGNFVGLDHVALSIVGAVLDAEPPRRTVSLLIDRNMTFYDYFTLYVTLARAGAAQKIKRLPGWVGRLFHLSYRVFKALGIHVGFLEKASQGSLHLYFRSERLVPQGRSLEESIRASLRSR